MKTVLKTTLVLSLLCIVYSCGNRSDNGQFTVTINTGQDNPLSLSAIADEIVGIELEMTDESIINPQRIVRVVEYKDKVIVAERRNIMLFDNKGRFIRTIGTLGQGPENYLNVLDITVDAKNENIYVFSSGGKIICYDLTGNLKKSTINSTFSGVLHYLNYVNNELILISESFSQGIDGGGTTKTAMLYTLDDDFEKKDSLVIHTITNSKAFWMHPWNDYISYNNKELYLYYGDTSPDPFVSDILYRYDNNQLMPYLTLDFTDELINSDGQKNIYIPSVYRSSRYVFMIYMNSVKDQNYYRFCYDLKTGKGYNMMDGYTDDIHTGEKVSIRPFNSNSERFYYLHTNMDDSENMEEPNPTLYIGTLKK